jgi:tRNA-specific adenosine deaminase 1
LATPTARGASSLSRAKLWGLHRNIIRLGKCTHKHENCQNLGQGNDPSCSVKDANSYKEFKRTGDDITDPLYIRQEAIHDAKTVLKGWVSNTGDEGWSLDVLVGSKKRKSEASQ